MGGLESHGIVDYDCKNFPAGVTVCEVGVVFVTSEPAHTTGRQI